MKWSVVGLGLSGVVAAVCAFMLTEALQVDARGANRADAGPPPPVDVLVAARAIPAMTVLDAGAVKVKSVRADQKPERSIGSPVRVVGRVLAVPVVEGQVFTPSCFAGEGSAIHLASALPEGKRAVSVSLADYSRLDGLLYPGSLVDVLASFRVPDPKGGRGDAVSTTLLQSIQVLAVDGRTVVSTDEDAAESRSPRRAGARRMVTLMVTVEQAGALQLATEHGTITLAMRNPLDAEQVKPNAIRLGDLSSVFGDGVTASDDVREVQAPAATSAPASQPAVPMWETVIIRGGKIETKQFALPNAETPADGGE